MKKTLTKVSAILIAFTFCIGLCACNVNNSSVYDAAKNNGLNNSLTEKEWSSNQSLEQAENNNSTKYIEENTLNIENNYNEFSLYQTYLDLVENEQYSGSFSDFIKEFVTNENDVSTLEEASINKCMLSAVSVYSICSVQVQTHYSTTSDYSVASGAGVIYKLDKQNGNAYIITNFHVVYFASQQSFNKSVVADKVADNIACFLYGTNVSYGLNENDEIEFNEYALNCEYVGGSSTYDIAILKVTNSDVLKTSSAQAVTCCSDSQTSVGSTAIAIGNPGGEGISVTKGIVSIDSTYIEMSDIRNSSQLNEFRVMKIDTPVNSGNSGGGLFNAEGELIGIVNAKSSDTSDENVGYAIPIILAQKVANNIIRNCDNSSNEYVLKATLGITIQIVNSQAVYDQSTLKTYIKENIKITKIDENALASGKLSVDDIIEEITLNIGGNTTTIKIERLFQISESLLLVGANDTITFKLKDAEGNNKPDVTITITADDLKLVA